MSVREKLIGIMGTAHPRLVSRLGTFGIGLAIVAVVATGVAVGGGTGTLQQAYAQEACPDDYTFDRGLCTAEPIPGEGGCPDDFPKQSVGGLEFCGSLVDQFPVPGAFACPTIVDEENNIIRVFAPDDPANPLSRGVCQIYQTADPLPSSEPSCPDTGNFREPEIVNGQCQVRPGEGEPEPGDDEEEEVEEGDE